MLNLWTAAWHSRPAGSLEDDDDVLADAAMCSPERWPEIRADVMRGWFKASDGRLYHPIVAEKVLDSWHGKTLARWRKECERVRKENGRRKEKGLAPLDLPAEPTRISVASRAEEPKASAGCPTDRDELSGGTAPERPDMAADDPQDSGPPSPACQQDEAEASAGHPPDSPTLSDGHPPDIPRTGHGIPPENALKGEGRDRDRKVRKNSEAKASGAQAPPCPDPKARLFGPGVDWLQAVTRKPNDRCRALIGKWRKDFGDDSALVELLAEAQRLNIEAPESWFPEAIKHRRALADGDRMPATAAEAIAMRDRDPAWAGVHR
jgi:hypothetical protein